MKLFIKQKKDILKSFRFTKEASKRLKALAKKFNNSQTNIVIMLVDNAYEEEINTKG